MKILYFDCKNGISGDMLLKALLELGDCRQQAEKAMLAERFGEEKGRRPHVHDSRHHTNHHSHHHGRSWLKVRELIEHSGFSAKARETALAIYSHIAEAEAKVHQETLETIHFHEVGRDEAIKNALGIGMALEIIAPDKIYTSEIYDGKGTVVCSHGEIPVPAPAVRALMEKCSYGFRTADVDTEMVTPSGLAGLMGIGAEPADKTLEQLRQTAEIIAEAEAKGGRDTGRGGLKVSMLERHVAK